MSRSIRISRASLVAVALASGVALAGCGLSPASTTIPYNASDGVPAQVGSIEARNLLVVGDKVGAPGVLSGVLINTSSEEVSVSIASGATPPVSVKVPGGGSTLMGTSSTPTSTAGKGLAGAAVVQFAALPAPAGAVIPLKLTTPDGGTTSVQVPVLPPTLQYASLTPTGTTPTVAGTDASATRPVSTETPPVTGTIGQTRPETLSPSKPVTPTAAPTGTASAESTDPPTG